MYSWRQLYSLYGCIVSASCVCKIKAVQSPCGVNRERNSVDDSHDLLGLFQNLNLQDYFLFAHGPDLCHESEIRHALANCFEALMGEQAIHCDSLGAHGQHLCNDSALQILVLQQNHC